MKRLSQITESIWGDLARRSGGMDVRGENSFNPDYNDFGPETTVYWAVDNLEIDGEVKFYFDDVKDYNNNGWRLPTVDEVNQLKWNVMISWYEGCKHLNFKDGNEFRLKTNGSGGFHIWTKEINTKFPTGAYAYGFDNSYKFDIDSFNKSFNRLFVFLVKDKKVNESIWGDLARRSGGTQLRAEDGINSMNGEDFYDYLCKHYKTLSKKERIKISENYYFYKIEVPLLMKNSTSYYLRIESDKEDNHCNLFVSSELNVDCQEFYQNELKNNDVFDIGLVDTDMGFWVIQITQKDGSECTNEFVLEVIDYILSRVEKPIEQLIEKI